MKFKMIFLITAVLFSLGKGTYADWASDHPECAVTPEMQELARSLDNDPVKIFNWVYNNIDFELYPGSRRGAFSTFLCKRGNDLDQSALLMALLKTANQSITSSYMVVDGTYDRSYIANVFSGGDDHYFDGVQSTNEYFQYFFMRNGFSGVASNRVKIIHHFVKAVIGGQTFYLDPAFKRYNRIEPVVDLASVTGFSTNEVISAFRSGATFSPDGNGIKNANYQAVAGTLTKYATNLVNALQTDYPGISANSFISGKEIIPSEISTLPTCFSPEILVTNQVMELSVLDTNRYLNFKITVGGGTSKWEKQYKAPEVAAKRLTLSFNASGQASLYLDGTAEFTDRACGSVSVTIQTQLPSENWAVFNPPISLSKPMTCGGNGRYALTHSLGDDCEALVKYHQNKLSDAYLSGLTDTAEAVWGGSLNLMSLSYNNQCRSLKNLLNRLFPQIYVSTATMGRAAAENSYFVDMNDINSFAPKQSEQIYTLGLIFGSAFEHGVVEQMQGSDNPGISSVKGIVVNNQQGKYTFWATRSNWPSVGPQLTASAKGSISNHLYMAGWTRQAVLTPETNVCVYPNSNTAWKGSAYLTYGYDSYGFPVIGAPINKVNGGYATFPRQFSYPVVFQQSFSVYKPPVAATVSTFRPVSFDPIDLYTGSFLVNAEDIPALGGNRQALSFKRSYTSEQNGKETIMGGGWRHNLLISAQKISHGEMLFSENNPPDMAAAVVAAYTAKKLLDEGNTLNSFMISSFAADWLVDQMVDNAVIVYEGPNAGQFLRQPDGSYNPPPGSKDRLIEQTNGTFVLKKPFGETITFSTNGNAASWTDADGQGLTLTYNSSNNLYRATDSYSRYLEFRYAASGVLTNVVDSTGRSIRYGYDTNKNLKTFTDAGNNTWNYNYDSKRRLTSITDPLAQVTVSNSYSALGCVTQQISSVNGTWKYACNGTESVEINPQGQTNRWFFDEKGRETGRQDALGRITAKAYDGQNRVTNTVNAAGVTNVFVYDSRHNLTEKREAVGMPAERVSYYSYDTNSHLVCVSNQIAGSEFKVSSFEYDSEHHLTKITDALGNETVMTYYQSGSQNGLLEQKTEDGGRITAYTHTNGNPATVASTDAGTQTFVYNARGELSSRKDAKNAETVFTYDTRGLLLKSVYPDGATVSNSYNGAGLLIAQKDARSNTVAYTYTPSYKVKTVTLQNNGVVSNTYDVMDRLIQTRDALGFVVKFSYDAAGQKIAATNHYGDAISYAYDAAGNLIQTVDESGRVVSSVYDALNRLVWTTDPLTNVMVMAYDALGNVLAVTNNPGTAKERTAYSRYDLLGRLTNQIDSLGSSTAFEYDALGNPVKTTDPLNRQTILQYNALGLVTNQLDALGQQTQCAYDLNGKLVKIIDARGYITTNGYDAAGRLIAAVDHLGGTVRQTYDGNGNVLTVTDAKGNVTSNSYDGMNQLLTRRAPSGITQYSYDLNGNLRTATDELGNVVSNSYDSLNRLTTVTDPLSGVRQIEYDESGRMTGEINPLNKHYTYQYDALGRETASIRPSGATENFQYDAYGNRLAFINAENKAITFGYDAGDRLTGKTNAIGKTWQYTYDNAGNLIQRTDAGGQQTAYLYDAVSRLTNVVHGGAWKASFVYDANGNLVNQQSAIANQQFSYDPLNRLANSAFDVSGFQFQVSNRYDANGNRTNIVYPGNKVLKYAYDAENRLSSVDLSAFAASSAVNFSYDSAGRLTNIVYPNGVNGTFVSDANGRITEFGYSRVGSNILRRAITRNLLGYKTQEDVYAGPVPNFTTGLRQTRTYNNADQMLSAGETAYSYDDNGNLTAASGLTYAWDYDNRLTGISGQGSVSYIYDASGARIGRVADGVTNYFILDCQSPLKQPLCETDGSGQITRYYIWSSHGLLAHLDMNPTNGAVVATSYYHFDDLGSTLALTDEAGAVTDQFTYSPYGEVLSHTGTNSTPYQWTGAFAVRSEGGGLYYMLNRYYSAEQKRFLSTDPMGVDGGANLYAYSDMNPLAFVDPFGLCAETFKSGPSGWDNFTSGLASDWQQLTQNQSQNTYAQSSFQYATPSGSQPSLGSTLYNVAATLTGARLISDAIYGYSNIGDPSRERLLSTQQRVSSGVIGALQFGSSLASIMEFGGAAGVSRGVSSASSLNRVSVSSGLPRSSGLSASQTARSMQGGGAYPGIDRFRDITLQKGKIIYGGTPGPSAFYTTESGLTRGAGSRSTLFQGLQVKPDRTFGYRGEITAYEVLEDTPAAFGRALANPQYGTGRLPQMVVPNYKNVLRPLYPIQLGQ